VQLAVSKKEKKMNHLGFRDLTVHKKAFVLAMEIFHESNIFLPTAYCQLHTEL